MTREALDPTWWELMARIFGPGGIALLITNAAGGYGIFHMWNRIKEVSAECQKEMDIAEARWETRFQQMRQDIKEAFQHVGELTKQVTLLAERAKTNTRQRDR